MSDPFHDAMCVLSKQSDLWPKPRLAHHQTKVWPRTILGQNGGSPPLGELFLKAFYCFGVVLEHCLVVFGLQGVVFDDFHCDPVLVVVTPKWLFPRFFIVFDNNKNMKHSSWSPRNMLEWKISTIGSNGGAKTSARFFPTHFVPKVRFHFTCCSQLKTKAI